MQYNVVFALIIQFIVGGLQMMKDPQTPEIKLRPNEVVVRVWPPDNTRSFGHVSLQTPNHYISFYPKEMPESGGIKASLKARPQLLDRTKGYLSSLEEDERSHQFHCEEIHLYTLDVYNMEFYFEEIILPKLHDWALQGQKFSRHSFSMFNTSISEKYLGVSQHSCASLVLELLKRGNMKQIIPRKMPEEYGNALIKDVGKGLLKIAYVGAVTSATTAASAVVASPVALLAKISGSQKLDQTVRDIIHDGFNIGVVSSSVAWKSGLDHYRRSRADRKIKSVQAEESENPHLENPIYLQTLHKFSHPSDVLTIEISPAPDDIKDIAIILKIFETSNLQTVVKDSLEVLEEDPNESTEEKPRKMKKLEVSLLDTWTDMQRAVREGKMEVFTRLWERYPRERHRKTGRGVRNGEETLLHIAAQHGRLNILGFLLGNKTIFIDEADQNFCTPFIVAIKYKQEEAARLLLEHGSNPFIFDDKKRFNALFWCADKGLAKLFCELWNKYPAIRATRTTCGNTCLHKDTPPAILDFLIKEGSLLNVKNKFKRTPLSELLRKVKINLSKTRQLIDAAAKLKAVVDLSDNGFDNISGIKALMQNLAVAKATHLKIKLTETNNPNLLRSLAAERLTNTLPIVFLDLSHHELTDDFIEETLAYLLEHNLTSLEEINLSHNNLTLKSLNILLALFSKLGWRNVKLLDLSHNYVEITSYNQLESLNAQLHHVDGVRINLTGNMVVSASHNTALLELLRCLIIRSQLSVKDFLESEFVGLAKVENESIRRFILTLKTKIGNLVNISMNAMEVQAFNEFRVKKGMLAEAELMFYLTKKLLLRHLEMDDDLLNCSLSEYLEAEQKARVKRLMDFHPDAPLSSRLITHSVFRSDHVSEAPTVLFPFSKKLTASHGMVYLVADKKNRHTRLIYEWLTDYGQRFIRIAHLTVAGKKAGVLFFNSGQIVIDFEEKSPLKMKAHFLNNNYYLIAGLEASRDKLEKMHTNIQDEKERGVSSRYKRLISAISSHQEEDKGEAEKRAQNCLKWATDHMKDDLGIALHITFYEPLAVVTKLRDNPSALLVSGATTGPKV